MMVYHLDGEGEEVGGIGELAVKYAQERAARMKAEQAMSKLCGEADGLRSQIAIMQHGMAMRSVSVTEAQDLRIAADKSAALRATCANLRTLLSCQFGLDTVATDEERV
jgi:hypothetical protein